MIVCPGQTIMEIPLEPPKLCECPASTVGVQKVEGDVIRHKRIGRD